MLIPDASKRQLRAVAHCPQRALEPVGWLIVMQKALEPIELLSRGESHRVPDAFASAATPEAAAEASYLATAAYRNSITPLQLLCLMMHTTAIRSSYATCMLPLVLVLPPPRCLCRRLLLPPLLLEQIVLQPQRTELPTIPLMLPIAATSADAPHCYSAWLAAAAAPDAANVAAEPVHATPRSALSSPPASADATQRRLRSRH